MPTIAYRAAILADEKPSEAVRVACIGVGGQGRGNMNAIKKHVVAVCDVDKEHLAAAAKVLEKGDIKPRTESDYRQLLAAKDIDAVVRSLPPPPTGRALCRSRRASALRYERRPSGRKHLDVQPLPWMQEGVGPSRRNILLSSPGGPSFVA